MNAVILASRRDRGAQLLPLAFPCPLLPVANRPLLEHQLAWLAGQGVKQAVVAIDHRGVSLTSPPPAGIDVRIYYAPGPMGVAAAVELASAGIDDPAPVLLVDGCLLTIADLEPLVEAHDRSGAAVTYAVPGPIGRRRSLRRRVPPIPLSSSLALVARDAGARAGEPRHQVYVPGYWRDLRSPAEYLAACLDALGGELGPLPGRELAPGLYAEGAVHILSSATLTGPILLGGGSVIGEHTSVSSSIVGSGCIVAAGARVERSVLLDGARIGRDAVVTDSIVGPSAGVADGASVTAGSVVGPGARIASGQQLSQTCVA